MAANKSDKKKTKVVPTEHMWQKGQSGNPSGRPKVPKDVRQAKQLTTHSFIKTVNKYWHMSYKEVRRCFEQMEDHTMGDLIVIQVLRMAIKEGDPTRLEMILKRVIGSVPSHITASIDIPNEIKSAMSMTPEEKWNRLKQIRSLQEQAAGVSSLERVN